MARALASNMRGLQLHGQAVCRTVNFLTMSKHQARHGQGIGSRKTIRAGLKLATQVLGPGVGARTGAKLASSALFGPLATKAKNKLSKQFGKNPRARPGFPGEKHVLLPTKFGPTLANFAGPGTQFAKRIARGDRGVDGDDGVDAQALKHDRRYVKAKTRRDIRKADQQMIVDVRRSTAGAATKAIIIKALKGKILGEKLGIFGPNTFTKVLEDDAARGDGLPHSRLLKKALKQTKKKPGAQKRKQHSSRPPAAKKPRQGAGPAVDTVKTVAKIVGPIVLKQVVQILLPRIIKRIDAMLAKRQRTQSRKRKRAI